MKAWGSTGLLSGSGVSASDLASRPQRRPSASRTLRRRWWSVTTLAQMRWIQKPKFPPWNLSRLRNALAKTSWVTSSSSEAGVPRRLAMRDTTGKCST